MAKQFSAVDLWDYGHRVLEKTKQVEHFLNGCYQGRGEEGADFLFLQQAICQLHDLLSNPVDVPPAVVTPPPIPTRGTADPDEIPF
jgi:hypothetical protein